MPADRPRRASARRVNFRILISRLARIRARQMLHGTHEFSFRRAADRAAIRVPEMEEVEEAGSMSDQTTISSMPLYTHLERVERALAALGIGRGDPIQPEQLFAIDQWHYHGTEAIHAAAEALGLGPASRVLDVGSGIGGPARYLAHTTGCHVTALELQPELHRIGADLTRRSGLEQRVAHVCGDALTYPLPVSDFDAAISWLAVLHVPDRPRLVARIARALRAGGKC